MTSAIAPLTMRSTVIRVRSVRAGPTRLLLAALVAGATGAASASGAGAAVEVAGAAGAVGLIRASTGCGAQLAPLPRGTCIQLGCSVRHELASIGASPAICAPPPAPAVAPRAPTALALVDTPAPPPRASAILPFAPKTSPPSFDSPARRAH